MAPVFRKAALDRLSSPEELDQVIRISNTGNWAALVAIILVCSAASVWAVVGELPTTATGRGMIVRSGDVLSVVARGAGIVRSIAAAPGQHVEANQVIARIGQPSQIEKIRSMRESASGYRVKSALDLKLKSGQLELRLESLKRQRENTERAIRVLEEQQKLQQGQVTVVEQLFTRGLVTNQQVLAERQKLTDLESQAQQRRADLKGFEAEAFERQSELDTLKSETDFESANREREIAGLVTDLSLMESVSTPYAGEVVEVKVSPGGMVAADTPILTIQPESENLEAIVYVPSQDAKDVRVGMEVRVSPSVVKREEYGFIRAKVSFVAAYPATTASLMRNFQNDQLVTTITSLGAVTEVRIKLERDPATVSGFRWSSAKGPPIKLSAGTLSTAEIVTQTRAPISLVIPLFREALGIG